MEFSNEVVIFLVCTRKDRTCICIITVNTFYLSYGYCNVFKFIKLRAVQNCKQCLHYGLTTFIKGKMKRKNALSHFEM